MSGRLWLSLDRFGSHFAVFGEFPTHFSGWIESDVHWGDDSGVDPWPYLALLQTKKSSFQFTLECKDLATDCHSWPLTEAFLSVPLKVVRAWCSAGNEKWDEPFWDSRTKEATRGGLARGHSMSHSQNPQ